MKRLSLLLILLLVSVGLLAGCQKSQKIDFDVHYKQVEKLFTAGKWEEGEQLLTQHSISSDRRYSRLYFDLQEKKRGDSSYAEKDYAQAFQNYNNISIKDKKLMQRTKNLAQSYVNHLQNEIATDQTNGECFSMDTYISWINDLSKKYPDIKFSPAKFKKQKNNCTFIEHGIQSMNNGDYQKAMLYFKKAENYKELPVVLYVLAFNSYTAGNESNVKKYLNRIPDSYDGPFSDEIKDFKTTLIPPTLSYEIDD